MFESANENSRFREQSISTMSLTIGFVEKGLEQQSFTSAFNYILKSHNNHLDI